MFSVLILALSYNQIKQYIQDDILKENQLEHSEIVKFNNDLDEIFIVLKDIQDASKHSEKEDVRLRALFKLADILDLEDKNQTKITQVSGALFQGFTPEQLENAERPQLVEGNNDGK